MEEKAEKLEKEKQRLAAMERVLKEQAVKDAERYFVEISGRQLSFYLRKLLYFFVEFRTLMDCFHIKTVRVVAITLRDENIHFLPLHILSGITVCKYAEYIKFYQNVFLKSRLGDRNELVLHCIYLLWVCVVAITCIFVSLVHSCAGCAAYSYGNISGLAHHSEHGFNFLSFILSRVAYRESELKKRQDEKRLLQQKVLEEQEERERKLEKLREQVGTACKTEIRCMNFDLSKICAIFFEYVLSLSRCVSMYQLIHSAYFSQLRLVHICTVGVIVSRHC